MQYLKAARYDDLLTIRTAVSECKGVRLGFKYEILRDNEKLAQGITLHAFVDRQGKPVRPPAWLRELLEE